MENKLECMVKPLLSWYDRQARILPWRETPTPYRVWISEIMLQQTRVEAVKPYFERFMGELPNICALASVSDERLLKLWEGLGYYNRARNLKKAAEILIQDYNGELPPSYDELLKLPGIGRYTAGAILSIAYGIAAPAVDGNVLRVVSRFLADYSCVSEQSVKRNIEQMVVNVMPQVRVGAFNQAFMELGATVCLPNGAPKCEICPVCETCRAFKDNCMADLPVKAVKKSRRIEQKTVFVLSYQDQIAVKKRGNKGLLAGLWEFPNVEGFLSGEQMQSQLRLWEILPKKIEKLGKAKHIFTHIEWHMTGYFVHVAQKSDDSHFVWVDKDDLYENFAIPTAFRVFKRRLY